MTAADMKEMGRQHALAGKELTPNACLAIDALILAAVRGAERPAKAYAKLRGAFNRGWLAVVAAQ